MKTMAQIRGIDVSAWQVKIDWDEVKKSNIDFVIIRAGYGVSIDRYFARNADECTRLGIPFGVYWFSYAANTKEAEDEAVLCCKTISKYKLQYPVCFDFEYDSIEKAETVGIKITSSLMCDIATAFLDKILENGYCPCLYTNVDFMRKGFKKIRDKYELWLAHWNVTNPKYYCDMWQYSSTGTINGIIGKVDLNYSYIDYPTIIAHRLEEYKNMNKDEQENKLENLKQKEWDKYYKLAQEVCDGKWGNGSARKKALLDKGYDYSFVQSIVNIIAK